MLRSRIWLCLLAGGMIFCAGLPLQAAVKYVKTTGNDSKDGSSWALAKKTVASAATAAVAGDEIWVAAGTYPAGTYVPTINLKSGVALLGGFAGTETASTQRNPSANVTILEGVGSGSPIVSVDSNASASTKLDGFTIRKAASIIQGGAITIGSGSPVISGNVITGNSSCGIYCGGGSPQIINNTIRGNGDVGISCMSSNAVIASNVISANSGAIYCNSGAPTILNNIITANYGVNTGGISCMSSNAVIASNVISANAGSGIGCSSGAPVIANNTITANTNLSRGAISLSSSSATVVNNIVASNSSGIYWTGTTGAPSLRKNCVFGNTAFAYSGFATDPGASNGNFAADPKLSGSAYGGWHLEPDSPCKDAGDSSVVQAGWLDLDGQARIQNGTVDVGADESDGASPPTTQVTIRVKPDGDDANNGSTWTLAKKTIQNALDSAAGSGGEVWVKAGTYSESITLPPYVYLYGGFKGDESERSQRDWAHQTSCIGGSYGFRGYSSTVVTIQAGYFVSCVDGFTIRNRGSGGPYYYVVYCLYASPTIANNTVFGGGATGILCINGSASITGNAIHDCATPIDCSGGTQVVTHNTITGNTGPILCEHATTAVIANNTIAGNSGSGVYLRDSCPVVVNNTLVGNGGFAICQDVTSPSFLPPAPFKVVNNLIAFNTGGIAWDYGGATPLRNNCVFGNTTNYSGLSTDPTGTNGNISQNPLLASRELGDFHIQPNSPCRNAGDNAYVRTDTDLDGQPRIQDGTVDIGVDESNGDSWNPLPGVVYVSPLGDDASDGAGWATAKKTVQAGIDAACGLGAEVWVREGVYRELINLHVFAYVYGGFDGTETRRAQRNWALHPSILDGHNVGTVVTASSCSSYAALDGFTIRGGRVGTSSNTTANGIVCVNSSPRISNNTITGNTGSGISCTNSNALIVNNAVIGNVSESTAGDAGIAISSGSPTVVNNTIAASGGGLSCVNSSATIANNLIAYNGAGVSVTGTILPVLKSNCVHGNSGPNYAGLATDPTGTNGNVSADPGLVSLAFGDLHIQPTSPCRNAGDNSFVQPDWLDMDGQTRAADGRVDIGAYESNGTPRSFTPAVVYVSPNGSDSSTGLSWADAKKTIQAGVDAASILRAEVWVQAGTYAESITLKPYAHLYGGFAGTETSRDQRDFRARASVIGGAAGIYQTVAASYSYWATSLDGFTIQGMYTGIYCGIGALRIANNRFAGPGISCDYASPLIENNTFQGGGAISCREGCYASIIGNSLSGCAGAGISLTSTSSTVTGNTIVACGGAGISTSGGAPVVTNNLIAFNGIGLSVSGTILPSLRNNCLFGNTSGDYVGIANQTGTNGNLSVDPKLASVSLGNMHLQPDSPCRNAGGNSAVLPGAVDIDGQPRIQEGTVDIGADETDGTTWTVSARVIRVAPEGDDANDGSSWSLAKKTVQAAVDAASSVGGEVWVKAGTYPGTLILRQFVYLYGGFAGTEDARSQRNRAVNKTTLSGGTVAVQAGHLVSTLDGFMIRGAQGDAIRCVGSDTTIANNVIRANGGGVYAESCSPVIVGNLIAGNASPGVEMRSSSAKIINNTLIANCGSTPSDSTPVGGGISCGGGSPVMVNNVIAYNTSGVYFGVGTAPTFRNNCLFANTNYIYAGTWDFTNVYGNILVDPLFTNSTYGDFHLQPSSPCINAGDTNAVLGDGLDIDGQPRVQGAAVDIGADESDGTTWSITPSIVRVRPDGDDANDGSSWALAKKTVQAAANLAAESGGEVWVKAGSYSEAITLPAFCGLYGGFAGTETERSQRDWTRNTSLLGPGDSIYYVVQIMAAGAFGTVDGFTIQNNAGDGIYCNHTSMTIANNTITNTACAVYCGDGACPTILNNTITNNDSTRGLNYASAVYCDSSSARIIGNRITGNKGIPIEISRSSGVPPAVILGNTIQANDTGDGSPVVRTGIVGTMIANNLIFENTGGGISGPTSGTSYPAAVNNTIARNTGVGITRATCANNLVAFNGGAGLGSGATSLRSNCLFRNNPDYSGPSPSPTDLAGKDPVLLGMVKKDYRLPMYSPCINAGSNADVQAGWTDLDGAARIFGPRVDIGCYEYQSLSFPFATTGGFVRPGRWNLVSVPADPENADPLSVFSGIDVPNASFQFWKNDTGGFQLYGEAFGWTGPIARGTPYWFIETTATAAKEISYIGTLPTQDFELTLPAHAAAPYWVMFGTPFPKPVPADSLQFKSVATRGDTWLNWGDAYSQSDSSLRLVESNAIGWSALANAFFIACPPPTSGIHQFDPWYGYWLLVYDTNELKIRFPMP